MICVAPVPPFIRFNALQRIPLSATLNTMIASSASSLYFAYGSNLNEADWADFCQRNGFDAAALKAVAPAVLPDMELAFDYYSNSRGGGALNIRPAPGHVVHGVLFRVSAAGWQALDHKEGSPHRYRRREHLALRDDGSSVPVLTYEVHPQARGDFSPPTAAYLQIVRDGLVAWGLPTAALEAAARGRPPAAINRLFVYGTLLEGERNAEMIPPSAISRLQPARSAGWLHDTGLGFPAFSQLPADQSSAALNMVEGECLHFTAIERYLPLLDRLEGFFGYGDQDHLFFRTLIEVETADGERSRAWCYTKEQPPSHWKEISHGSWRHHHQTMLAEA